MNLLNVTLDGRVKTQLFALMNPSVDGLGQIPVCERVSHPRHDQQEVEGTRHRRSFFLMARHTVVEGRERAQEGGAVPTQLGLNQSEHQFPQETVEGRCLLL